MYRGRVGDIYEDHGDDTNEETEERERARYGAIVTDFGSANTATVKTMNVETASRYSVQRYPKCRLTRK
jgi:hypothetical protein